MTGLGLEELIEYARRDAEEIMNTPSNYSRNPLDDMDDDDDEEEW